MPSVTETDVRVRLSKQASQYGVPAASRSIYRSGSQHQEEADLDAYTMT
jgi:hypothetical protein